MKCSLNKAACWIFSISKKRGLTLLSATFICNFSIANLEALTTLTVNVPGDDAFATGGSGAGTSGDLRYVLNQANQTADTFQINFALTSGNETIVLQSMLPPINLLQTNTIVIDGSNDSPGSGIPVTILGLSGVTPTYPGFFVRQGDVTIQNLIVSRTIAKGGNGGAGGAGGAMGAGGALFIDQANVSLSGVIFSSNTATGGNSNVPTPNAHGGGGGMFGGDGGGADINGAGDGGGGMGGPGGTHSTNSGSCGGGAGGGIGPTAIGGQGTISSPANAGNSGVAIGASVGGRGAGGALGGANGGGGGGGGNTGSPTATTPSIGGGGGGDPGGLGAPAGYGGGGGGGGGISPAAGGGAGGFGGGGGGNAAGSILNNAGGGFGGGAGAYTGASGGFGGGGSSRSSSGVGGGNVTLDLFGGGGMGCGGAIFVNSGGTLNFTGSANLTGGAVNGGMGGGTGLGASVSTAIFALTGNALNFNPGLGNTVTIAGSIGDNSANTLPGGTYTAGSGSGNGLTKNGLGVTVLCGTNTYAGDTIINAGTLSIGASSALGSSSNAITISNGTLLSTGTFTLSRPITLTANAGIGAGGGANLTVGSTIAQSGTGSLTKYGQGTVTLIAANSFTGGVTVDAGALVLSAAGSINSENFLIVAPTNGTAGTFSISGIFAPSVTVATFSGGTSATTVLGDKNLTFGNSSSTTYSGVITGTGASTLTKIGSGTVTLAATSGAYAGTTNLSAGTLELTASNAAGTGVIAMAASTTLSLGSTTTFSNTVTLAGAEIITVNSNTASLNGVISGLGGSFTKAGEGILVLGATNTYTGGTNLSQGSLSLQTTGALGTGTLSSENATTLILVDAIAPTNAIDIGGTLTVNIDSGSATLSGVLDNGSSTGSILKTGNGTLILTSDNLHVGETCISSGIVALSTSGGLSGDLHLETAVFDYSGISEGSAELGNIAITGIASITNGIKNLSFVSGTISNDVTFTGSGNVTKDGSDPFTVVEGKLFDVGAGNVNISGGINSIYGAISATSVTNDSSLLVNGAIDCINMTNTGTLFGNGSITGEVTNQGIIAPGQSIGTLHIAGDYIEIGTYEVEINPSASDLIAVSGNYTISPGAILAIQPESGRYTQGTSYTIVDSGGTVFGAYGTVTTTFPLLKFSVVYESSAVKLELAFSPFTTLVNTGNPGDVAAYLDLLTPIATGDLAYVIEELHTLRSISSLTDALNQMHPAMLKALPLTQQNNLFNVRRIFNNRIFELYDTSCMREADKKKNITLWGDVFGDVNNQEGVNAQLLSAFHTWNSGVLAGVDYKISKNFLVGACSGYSYSQVKWSDKAGRGNINSGYLGLYASAFNDLFFSDVSILGSYSRFEGKRYVGFADINRVARHHNQGLGIDYHGGVGSCIPIFSKFMGIDTWIFGSIDYQHLHEQGFTEKGAKSINLVVKGQNYNVLRAEVGFDFAKCFVARAGYKVIPNIKFSWVREIRFNGEKYQAHFRSQPGEFTVTGLNPSRTMFAPGIGIRGVSVDNKFSFGARYDLEKSKNFLDQMLNFQVSYSF